MSINIVTLAGSGAGKTVYLSSIYQKFSIQDKAWPYQFRLDTSQENGRKLNKFIANLVNPDEDFPPGTRELTHWSFDCKVKTSQGIYSVYPFNYVDYAGELVNYDGSQAGQEKNLEKLNYAIKEANALIVLLDGIEVFQLVKGKKGKQLSDWLNKDLKNILDDIQDTATPVYFVITKWDVMQNNFNSQLQEVRDELLQLEIFQKFISNLTGNQRNRTIRLIPISSLGDSFAAAELDKDGVIRGMKKTGKLAISPYNVELPLAYALLDTLMICYKRYEQRDLLTRIALRAASFAIGGVCPPGLVDLFNHGFDMIKKFQDDPQDPASDLAHVTNQKLAIRHLLSCFFYMTRKFESDYPGSVLNHPRFFP